MNKDKKEASKSTLEPIAIQYKLPDGTWVTESEINSKFTSSELNYGFFESQAKGIGSMMSLFLPDAERGLLPTDEKSFNSIISAINEWKLDQKKEEIKVALQKSDFLRFYLIDMLMTRGIFVKNCLNYKLSEQNKALMRPLSLDEIRFMFKILIDAGAEYKHLISSQAVNTSDLKNYVNLLGKEILNITIGNLHFLTTLINGKSNGKEVLLKVEFAVQNGSQINTRHKQYGTFLHVLIANEHSEKFAIAMIELIDRLNCNIDYSLQDSEGKTLLLLAAKLRQNRVVKKLLELRKKGRNININSRDHEGRTPLQIACVLGDEETVKALLDASADTVDINQYLETKEDIICALLKSIHIEPGRDARAPHNWVYYNDSLLRPLIFSEIPEADKRVLISKKTEHWERLKRVCELANPELRQFILNQLRPLLENEQSITVLEKCLQGRIGVKKVVERFQKQSLPVSIPTKLFDGHSLKLEIIERLNAITLKISNQSFAWKYNKVQETAWLCADERVLIKIKVYLDAEKIADSVNIGKATQAGKSVSLIHVLRPKLDVIRKIDTLAFSVEAPCCFTAPAQSKRAVKV